MGEDYEDLSQLASFAPFSKEEDQILSFTCDQSQNKSSARTDVFSDRSNSSLMDFTRKRLNQYYLNKEKPPSQEVK